MAPRPSSTGMRRSISTRSKVAGGKHFGGRIVFGDPEFGAEAMQTIHRLIYDLEWKPALADEIQTTFDVYGHLLPGSHDEVRQRMDQYLGGGQQTSGPAARTHLGRTERL